MPEVDQFESIFKAASRTLFERRPVEFRKILVVTDRERDGAEAFAGRVRAFLKVFHRDDLEWRVVSGEEFDTVGALIELVKNAAADLICSYRNLQSTAWKWPYSLGAHLDVLSQIAGVPLLVFPHPEAGRELEHAIRNTDRVMALTNHLVGDHSLINTAAAFTEKNGTLYLTHVEDRATFERYMDIVSKIPQIDTDLAREEIVKRLLKEPNDYIRSCREVMEREKVPVTIREVVTLGTRLKEYRELIENHKVDLLVLHVKDEDQMAMHGMAYPLTVELREIPLLLV